MTVLMNQVSPPKFFTPAPLGISHQLKISYPDRGRGVTPEFFFDPDPGQGVTPAKLFNPDPGRGITPANIFDPDPGQGLTPAIFLTLTPAGVDRGRGQPRRGRDHPGLNPGPRKTLAFSTKLPRLRRDFDSHLNCP